MKPKLAKHLTLYIDISRFLDTRLNTGIQRVIKEFLLRSLKGRHTTNVIYFDTKDFSFKQLSKRETHIFLNNTKEYTLKPSNPINILKSKEKNKIFFDLDAVWNATPIRTELYPKLKKHHFKIYNFIYDIIPIKFPSLLYSQTQSNFPHFIEAVATYSDFIFFDSHSAKEDFLSLKPITTKTQVIHLGSDFTHKKVTKAATNHKNLLATKYILFVGTIEPRKKQALVFEAFLELHKTHPYLHLIFIGKIGWGVEPFIYALNTHPLKDKHIHHLTTADDTTLEQFYQNAHLVTYLSEYEGYGLPVAESLRYSNITLASKNSSIQEVGKDFADYLETNDKPALLKMLSSYLENQERYRVKKQNIIDNYKPISWDDFYLSLVSHLNNDKIPPHSKNQN